ncbi:hypothetical protein [Parachryseolinea silvisoli]|uniref:hypothetical protein n=1 Tax=Parachryseolinea silvisoli TaxID=2873601 RepID=UPI002265F3F2|nr:hypothetical protein [Parachryseolinea silvisoli]MCD9016009.1 hypothetical protein [Parachryseolinea silvisoli]
MAFLEGLKFTGKLGELSAYRMRGCSKIVVRRKGGPSAEQIKKSPNFANTRYTMSEFGGCSRMGKHVRYALHPLKALADNNFGSDINSVMRKVQLQDKTSLWGRRDIILSDYARILEGFPLNTENPTFDSVVRNPVYYTIDRERRAATVDIPHLLRSINYFPQNNHAMFRVIVTLGVVPDMTFDTVSREFQPPKWFDAGYFPTETSTTWYPSLEGMPATTLALEVNETPPDNGWSLMLSIGIQYGALHEGGEIKEVKRFGAAKIVALRGRDNGSSDASSIGEEKLTSGLVETPADVESEAAPHDNTPTASIAVSTQTFSYHYVSTSAPTTEPEAATYTYSYTIVDTTTATSRPVKRKVEKSPASFVEAKKPKVIQDNKRGVEQWCMTGGPLYGNEIPTVVASPRYIMLGQWRL